MKDKRVAFFRTTLDSLIDSLEAVVRSTRWQETEEFPEPLRQSAASMGQRLGVASRLAADKFVGAQSAATPVVAMQAAMQRLDAAYVQYQRSIKGTREQRDAAALALDAEVDSVKADASRWSYA